MKKILCIALSVIMLTLALPIAAFAEENNYECTVSTDGGEAVGHASYTAAMKNLTAGHTYIVNILKDVAHTNFSLGEAKRYKDTETSIVIYGNDHKITVSQGNFPFYYLGEYTLEVNDLYITHDSGFNVRCQWSAESTATKVTTFNNCTFDSYNSTQHDGLFLMKGAAAGNNVVLNLNGCTVSSAAECVFNVFNGTDATINITDTTITHNAGRAGWNANALVLCVNDNTKCTVNVKGASNLIVAPNFAWDASELSPGSISNDVSSMFYARTGAPELTVNLSANDDGDLPTLFMNILDNGANDTRTLNKFVVQENSAKVTLNDAGATYKATAFAATKGIYLPASDVPYYATTGEIATAGSAWTTSVEDNTADVEFIPVSRMFDTLDGASLRLSNPSGIRFESEIDDRLLAVDGVTFGMLLAPTAALTADTFTVDYVTENGYINHVAGDNPYYKENGEDTKSILRAALTGIPVDNASVNTKLSARAYIMIGEDIYYAAYDDNNSRSMYDVAVLAQAAIDAGTYDVDTDDQAIITAVITAGANA